MGQIFLIKDQPSLNNIIPILKLLYNFIYIACNILPEFIIDEENGDEADVD